MKYLELKIFLLLFFSIYSAQCQEEEKSKVITKYIITHASKNDIDITENLLKERAYLVLYKNNNSEPDTENLSLANVWDVSDSQSFGRIYNLKSTGTPENEESYKTSTLDFNWSYQNSYDDESGTAKVKIFNVYKPAGITFTITIFAEDLDILEYKGFVDGSLDSSIFKEITDNQFSQVYNKLRIFDDDTNEWSPWTELKNTFWFNYNSNNDIKHLMSNGEEVLYRKDSEIEEGTDDGNSYQKITMIDENGLRFDLQIFYESSIGLKMIYGDVIIHLSEQ